MKLHHLASATAVLLTAFSSGTASASVCKTITNMCDCEKMGENNGSCMWCYSVTGAPGNGWCVPWSVGWPNCPPPPAPAPAAASSLRGRVAVNSDSVDSEDYYYFPEVEDYDFVEEEDPDDLDDEDMELYWKGNNLGGGWQERAQQAQQQAQQAAQQAQAHAQRVWQRAQEQAQQAQQEAQGIAQRAQAHAARVAQRAQEQANQWRNYGNGWWNGNGYVPY